MYVVGKLDPGIRMQIGVNNITARGPPYILVPYFLPWHSFAEITFLKGDQS